MKKFVLAVSMLLSVAPVFAQRYMNCRAGMVDRTNRVVRVYHAQTDYSTGMCREGLRLCHLDMQRRPIYGARCVQLR